MKSNRLVIILSIAFVILLIPLIAMQFTEEVNWEVPDFIIAGILLLGTGFLMELVIRKIKKQQYRILLIGALAILLILIWVELAVGVFGTPLVGN